MTITFNKVGVVGVGAMGQGIAQMAAQAGAQVHLFDTQAPAVEKAIRAITQQWQKMLEKGRISSDTCATYTGRLHACESLAQLSVCDLVIEAIVENLAVKKELFAQLEALVPASTVLATNTSSLSVTAIAAQLKQPQRFAGYHFFNPVPLMRVVEVVAGLKTSDTVCAQLDAFTRNMGHTPVRTRDTPGFIVNHAGRGYGTEALRIVGESVSDFATIDRILKDQVGFKLGPFELMDLTALDVSHPVMESIYQQYYEEPRFRPSIITAQRLSAGVLGRKTNEGFYSYVDGKAQMPAELPPPMVQEIPPVWVSPRAARRPELLQLLKSLDARIETSAQPSEQALILVAPLGFDVTTVAAVDRLDPHRTLGLDLLFSDTHTKRRVLASNPATRPDMRQAAHALFARDGKPVSMIRDSAGFVSQRVVAHIVNIASDICQQGICTPPDLETAVQLGLGYPMGPLAMGDHCGPASILEVLFNMQTVYGDPRYRPSPWLRRRGALGLSLMQTED